MNNQTFLRLVAAVASCATLSVPAVFADGIEVSEIRARPSLGAAKNSATFFTLKNTTGKADKLISAQGDVAKKIELHTHLNENGVMKMRPVPAIDIPANGEAVLKSGGLHVMLMGVKSKLKIGDTFKLKLNFANSGPVEITVPVKKIGAHGHMKHMKMNGMKKMDHMKKKATTN